jgi:hypothetical protein
MDHYRTARAECRARPLKVRQNIDSLSAQELADFRSCGHSSPALE